MALRVAVRYVLDSNAVIYEVGGSFVDPLPKGTYFVSIISKIELLSFAGITTKQKRAIEAILDRVQVVGIDDEIVAYAIRLRRLHRLKLPDALIAATAKATRATLITHDAQLLRLPGIKTSAPPIR